MNPSKSIIQTHCLLVSYHYIIRLFNVNIETDYNPFNTHKNCCT